MIATAFTVLTWLLGIAGVGTPLVIVGACFLLGPAVVVPIVRALVGKFLQCTICVVVSAFVFGCIVSFWIGHHDAVLDCRADKLNAELATKQADVDNARLAASDADARANAIEANAGVKNASDQDYIKSLEARPACNFDDTDVGGVQHNRRSGFKGFTRNP